MVDVQLAPAWVRLGATLTRLLPMVRYRFMLNAPALLRPFSEEHLGDWPHTLWVAPGLPTFPQTLTEAAR